MKAYAPLNCAKCGTPISEMRFGVYMRPLWLRIIDVVTRAGPDGISGADLTAVIYTDRAVSRHLIPVHVHNINTALAATDYRIQAGRGQGARYRIVKINTEAA